MFFSQIYSAPTRNGSGSYSDNPIPGAMASAYSENQQTLRIHLSQEEVPGGIQAPLFPPSNQEAH